MIDIDSLPTNELKLLAKQINLLTQNLQEWISAKDAKKILGIKSTTKLLQLRDSGQIVFSQFGRTILYSRKSLNDFLNRHAVKL
ncbi:MAG TPA: helix-turn-helix domain-containing protein [Cytophagaceae bacterium]|jgi:hypothetical protein